MSGAEKRPIGWPKGRPWTPKGDQRTSVAFALAAATQGARVQGVRVARGITREQLAQDVGCSEDTVKLIEYDRVANSASLPAIAEMLDVPLLALQDPHRDHRLAGLRNTDWSGHGLKGMVDQCLDRTFMRMVDLAQMTGVSYGKLWRICNERQTPDEADWKTIADAFTVPHNRMRDVVARTFAEDER